MVKTPAPASAVKRAPSQRRSRGTPQRSVRVADPLWYAALDKAAKRGDTVAGVITSALEVYVAEPDEDEADLAS